MSVELSNMNSSLPSKQPTDYGSDLLAFSCATFGMWIVAPILHAVGWPVAEILVSAFFRVEYSEFARQTHVLASLLLACSGLYTATKLIFVILRRQLNTPEK